MELQEFDYVVVGGGAGGCVVASRLSEDPAISVCLLEAGGPDTSAFIHAPLGFAATAPLGIHSWGYNTVPQAGLNGRIGFQPRGKVLGGSTSVNAMVYTRGNRQDYDNWAALGNPGWTYDDVLPVVQEGREQRVLRRRRLPRHRRAIERELPAQPECHQRGLPAGLRVTGTAAHQGLQRRAPVWCRARTSHPERRRALERGQGLYHASPRSGQPAGCHACPCQPCRP